MPDIGRCLIIYYVSELETLSKIMLVFRNDEFKIRIIVGHTVLKVTILYWKNKMTISGNKEQVLNLIYFPS